MVVSARDANGNALLYQYEQYFDAENGDSLVTTLDKTVQYYLEKGLEELESRYGTGVGATGIVMDVNTGGILAMASLPTSDLNAPRASTTRRCFAAGMTDEELAAAADTLQNMQWRNKAINDTFQPGSTFKILTLAMALRRTRSKCPTPSTARAMSSSRARRSTAPSARPVTVIRTSSRRSPIPATPRSSTSACASATRPFTIT